MPRKTTRRGKNEGSIYQRKDGIWCGQVLLGYKLDGKPRRKTVYGKTREDVARKVISASHDSFNGMTPTENTNVTIGQFIMDWVMKFKRAEVEPCTFEWYLSTIKTHIIPLFGSIQLTKLSTYQIQEAINELKLVKKLKWRSLKAFRDTLNQAMKHACKMNFLLRNPVDGTKLPKRDRNPSVEGAKALPIEVRTVVLEAAKNDAIMKPIIFTLMFTGLRSGELLSLRWDNIDFRHGTLTVDSAVAIAPDYDENGTIHKRVSVLSMPKTEAGYRTIKLPTFVLDALIDWKLYIDGKKPEHDHFVFCSTKTGGMRTYQGFKASFRHFLERNNLTEYNITPHMFRHTFASILLENNVNPKVVQRLLGHADIQTTLGVYSHVMKEVYSGVAEALDDIYTATIMGTYRPTVGASQVLPMLEQDFCSSL